jgi:hypothetical protein
MSVAHLTISARGVGARRPLALALVPQATLPALPVAVAPAPLAVAGGTVAPFALPTQTNCACACGAPSARTSTSAVPADEIKDKRTRLIEDSSENTATGNGATRRLRSRR